MIGQKQIDRLKAKEGLAWSAALKSGAIRMFVESGKIQMDLFDERNLFEVTQRGSAATEVLVPTIEGRSRS